jgi:hypothetical protein
VSAWYRLQQFWQIVTAQPLTAEAQTAVDAILPTAAQRRLFQTLSLSDQWHSLRVMQTLQAAGQTDPDLLTAALLHDVGKTKLRLTLWDRTLIVLAGFLWPGKLAAWGRGDGQDWRRPFVVKARHPEWSAEMATAVGCSPRSVSLMRRHQDKLTTTAVTPEDALLQQLQWADDQN